MTPTVYMLIGPPASGKSTWREKHLAQTTRPTVTVSSDDVIEEFGRQNGMGYDEAWSSIDQKWLKNELYRVFDEAVRAGHDVIHDRTNMSVRPRNRFLCRVPRGYRKVAVVFSAPREVLDQRLLDRALATGKSVPKSAVDEMLGRYEPPTRAEFHEIRTADGALVAA